MQITWANNYFVNDVVISNNFDNAVHMSEDIFDHFLTSSHFIRCFRHLKTDIFRYEMHFFRNK